MTFVDTSAIYAVLDRNDANYEAARNCWLALVGSGAPLFTTNYVVVESCALAQRRLGTDAVRAIHEDLLPVIEIFWVDGATHELGMTALLAAHRRELSLVDCASFAAMRAKGSRVAFAFGPHFAEERFAFPFV